jgi:hypothetical protein
MLASGAGPAQTTRVQLGERERAVLDVERDWWMRHPTKEAAIADRLGCAPSSYYRILRAAIENPAAMTYDPLVVRRLIRARRGRRRTQMEGTWSGRTF